MSFTFRVKKLLLDAVSVLVHFAHGGLLTIGVLVSLFVGAHYWGVLKLDPVKLWSPFGSAAAAADVSATAPAMTAVEAEVEAETPPVRPGMRGVIDYLSKRYRVAGAAVEPLVQAAHLAGTRVGLDPLLIIAVVAVESRFNPIAESHMGAQGLMQVIPRFHKDKVEDPEALLDPETNILVGAQVLKESIRRAGGLEAGLQQYAGAATDAEAQYAGKVIAEKQRLEQAMRKHRRMGA